MTKVTTSNAAAEWPLSALEFAAPISREIVAAGIGDPDGTLLAKIARHFDIPDPFEDNLADDDRLRRMIDLCEACYMVGLAVGQRLR